MSFTSFIKKIINPFSSKHTENEEKAIVRQKSSLWLDAIKRFKKNRAAIASFWVVIFLVVFVTIGPYLNTWTYSDIDWDNIASAPSWEHLFGTDENGRDILARITFGGRISLLVGFVGTSVAISVGVVYGAISGFVGGKVDMIMMRIIEILDALPFLFLIILLLTFFGRSLFLLFLGLGILSWLGVARVVRGLTLSIRNREYIEACHVIGISTSRTLFKHIVPNLIGIIIIYSSLMVPGMIMTESFLSYLGLGVQEPLSSWGSLISDGQNSMQTSPWMLIFPSIFLATIIYCSNYIGDGLRDALDPKDR